MTTQSQKTRVLQQDFILENFGYSRVALVLTGSAVTHAMPYWIRWAREALPDTEFRIIMRESAYRFVTRHGIESSSRSKIQDDLWGEEIIAEHIELAEWAELILIYPATLDYSSRLAHGITDSPSLLAAISTDAQVCIAPSFPPRSEEHPIVMETLEKLRAPSNFLVIDPVPGPSESSDIDLAWIPPSFFTVLKEIEDHRVLRQEVAHHRAA